MYLFFLLFIPRSLRSPVICDITGIIMGVPTFVTVQWVVALPSVLFTDEATRVGCLADITHLYPARCRPLLLFRHYYQTCWLDEMEWSVGWRPVAAHNTQGWWARGGGTQNPEGRAWCLAPVVLRVEGRLRGEGVNMDYCTTLTAQNTKLDKYHS